MFKIGQRLRLPTLANVRSTGTDVFVVREIHLGGMGSCLKVRCAVGEDAFAVKVIHAHLIPRDSSWARYLQELEVWVTLSASNGVVQAFCVDRVNEIPCVCAEWMEGGNLRKQLRLKDPMAVLSAAARLVSTLDWCLDAHAVIHRDLKPENVLLDKEGLCYVSDWGLAKLVDRHLPSLKSGDHTERMDPKPHLTGSGQFLGTVRYSPPEQIRGLTDIDHRADIYALGCVLYEWAAGRPPFVAGTAAEIASQHLRRPAPSLTSAGAWFPELESVVARCLAKNPSERYQSYSEFQTAIGEVASSLHVQLPDFTPDQRYGQLDMRADDVNRRVDSIMLARGHSSGGYVHGLVELDDISPMLLEADALIGLGKFASAKKRLEPLVIPSALEALPDFPPHQALAITYAVCLVRTGQAKDAVSVLRCLRKAKKKPSEYYVNLSLAQLATNAPDEAEASARKGLTLARGDPDLLGNLLIALSQQSKFKEAEMVSELRLAAGRDVHALEETANLQLRIGMHLIDRDWPQAMSHLRACVRLSREAVAMNPRWVGSIVTEAQAHYWMGRTLESSKLVKKLFDLHPPRSIGELAVVLMARCLDQQGAHKACVGFCDNWLKEFPANAELSRVRAETIVDGFCIGKELDGVRVVEPTSLAFFEQATSVRSDAQISDLCYMARLREWMQDLGEAMQLLDAAEQSDDTCWEVPHNRAQFLWRAGRHGEALAQAKRASSLAPWRPQPFYVMRDIYTSLDRPVESAGAGRKAEEIAKARRVEESTG
ncbi:MAG: serine/threonine-protein kinase [bacterium]